MPTVYIPTTNIGYSPAGAVNSPLQFTTSTGAVLYFPNLYVDIKGIPWLFGGTAWAGTRYYKRESIYISDFFYWNPSGVGAGIEDIRLGQIDLLSTECAQLRGLRRRRRARDACRSYGAAVAVADRLRRSKRCAASRDPSVADRRAPAGVPVHRRTTATTLPRSGGWGATLQFVQLVLGGDNKLAFQYGKRRRNGIWNAGAVLLP